VSYVVLGTPRRAPPLAGCAGCSGEARDAVASPRFRNQDLKQFTRADDAGPFPAGREVPQIPGDQVAGGCGFGTLQKHIVSIAARFDVLEGG